MNYSETRSMKIRIKFEGHSNSIAGTRRTGTPVENIINGTVAANIGNDQNKRKLNGKFGSDKPRPTNRCVLLCFPSQSNVPIQILLVWSQGRFRSGAIWGNSNEGARLSGFSAWTWESREALYGAPMWKPNRRTVNSCKIIQLHRKTTLPKHA